MRGPDKRRPATEISGSGSTKLDRLPGAIDFSPDTLRTQLKGARRKLEELTDALQCVADWRDDLRCGFATRSSGFNSSVLIKTNRLFSQQRLRPL